MSQSSLRFKVPGDDSWAMNIVGMADTEAGLVRLCLETATDSKESVEKWRRQVRTLGRMPYQLTAALFHRLLRRHLLYPSLLEIFKHSLEEIDLRHEIKVDFEWMAYVGGFPYLRLLNLSDCVRLTNDSLWPISGMINLKGLNLSRCPKISNATVGHLTSIPTLERLWISETGITENGVKLLSSLTKLSLLDLGGLRVTDDALYSLQVLTELQYLDLWGSEISNKGASVLKIFPKLSFLSLEWTSVTLVPNLPSLTFLNMSNCVIDSIFEGIGVDKNTLTKLVATGATFVDVTRAFNNVDKKYISILDLSRTSLRRFCFLHNMNSLQHLDLSNTELGDASMQMIASIGSTLRDLNLSNTKITSAGFWVLAGHVPNLEVISLSKTSIDDMAVSYLGLMHSLKVINLSNTSINGFIYRVGHKSNWVPSIPALQSLKRLEKLDLDNTEITDFVLYPLRYFQELKELSLKSVSLSDESLYNMSSVPNLKKLSLRNAVLTNGALDGFNPPKTLKYLNLEGCWLLTKDAIFAFHDRHPQIELIHDSNASIPSKDGSSKHQWRKLSKSKGSNSNFIDQRFKYSIQELLALNYSFQSHTLDG